MVKTHKVVHINDCSVNGYVKCPACRGSVPVNQKYCTCCGEYVNYKYNYNVLAKWDLDLFNNSLGDIKNGLVEYSKNISGDDKPGWNAYDLEYGRSVIPEPYTSYDHRYYEAPGVFIVCHSRMFEGGYGILDRYGNTILAARFDRIDILDSKGYFVVKKEGKVGVCALTRELIIPFEYDLIKPSSISNNNFFIVRKDNKYGMIDFGNLVVVPIEFDDVGEYSEGFIAIQKEKKWGYYCHKTKEIKIPFRFDKADKFKDGCAKVVLGGTELYIDENGFPTLPKGYGEKEVIENGRVVIRGIDGQIVRRRFFDPTIWRQDIRSYKVNDKEGAITPEGYFVISPEYDSLRVLESNLCVVKKDGKCGVITHKGYSVLPLEYSDVWVDEGLIRISGPNYPGRYSFVVSGYIDRNGNVIVPQEYMWLGHFQEGLCLYEGPRGQQCGIMDKFGNYVEYHPLSKDGKWQLA